MSSMSHLGHSTVGASLRYQHMVDGRAIEIAEGARHAVMNVDLRASAAVPLALAAVK